MRLGWSVWALALAGLAQGQEPAAPKPVWRFQVEVLYTMHASVDTAEKLERIRALVLNAYPGAKFAEVSVEDRKTYFGIYRDRLLARVGKSFAEVGRAAGAEGNPKDWDDALRQRAYETGYALVKDQVGREVELRSIYQFLHLQAKDEESLKVLFDRLKEKDDPKNPVCGTEPGKTLMVYRDFGGKGLTRDELIGIEDSGVKFGFSFVPRVTHLGTEGLPKLSLKADTLGDEGEGRQIFRVVAVTKEPASPPDPK